MKIKKFYYAWLLLFLLSLIWGSSPILIKKALITLNPFEIGALRLSFAALVLLPFLAKSLRDLKKNDFYVLRNEPLTLEQEIIKQQFPADDEDKYLDIIKSILAVDYAEFIGDEIQKAYIDSYQEYGQNIFDKYVLFADCWMNDTDYRDPDTGEIYERGLLNDELEKIEKPAGIANTKDFRHEIVNFFLRHKANNNGEAPRWTSYNKIKNVIEKRLFSNTEDLLPVISFGSKQNKEDKQKHNDHLKYHCRSFLILEHLLNFQQMGG